jgi:hypothetical protein
MSMIYITAVFGLIIVGLGSLLKHFVGARRFQRRNSFGAQEFATYSTGVGSGMFEGVVLFAGRALSLIGWLFVLFAAAMFVYAKMHHYT